MPCARPKIAFVVSTVLQIHAFMRPHMRALAKEYDITICLPDDLPALRDALDLPVTYHFIPIERKISPWRDLKALAALIVHFRKARYAAVHTITPKAGLLGTLASFAARVPIRIHTFQGEVWATATGRKRAMLRGFDRLIARLSTHQTVVSRSERAFLRREGVLSPTQGAVLGAGSIGGVDLQRFRPDPATRAEQRARLGYGDSDVVFLFLGRMTADKGIAVLDRAFGPVAEACPEARLLLVGPDEGAVPRARDRQVILPFTDRPEAVMQAADVLVFPSFREGFGVVVLEAAALGLPAIGSDIYGVEDAIVDGQTGYLVPVRDAQALAGRMIDLCQAPDLRRQLGAAARARVEAGFDQQTILAAFLAFYDGLALASDKVA